MTYDKLVDKIGFDFCGYIYGGYKEDMYEDTFERYFNRLTPAEEDIFYKELEKSEKLKGAS